MQVNGAGGSAQAFSLLKTQNHHVQQQAAATQSKTSSSVDPEKDGDVDSGQGPDVDTSSITGKGSQIEIRA